MNRRCLKLPKLDRRPIAIPAFSTELGVQAATTPTGRCWTGAARPVISSRRRTDPLSVQEGVEFLQRERRRHGVALGGPGEGLVGGPGSEVESERLLVDDEEAVVNLSIRRGFRLRQVPADLAIRIRPDSIAWTGSQGRSGRRGPGRQAAAAVDDLGAEQVGQAHARLPAACR